MPFTIPKLTPKMRILNKFNEINLVNGNQVIPANCDISFLWANPHQYQLGFEHPDRLTSKISPKPNTPFFNDIQINHYRLNFATMATFTNEIKHSDMPILLAPDVVSFVGWGDTSSIYSLLNERYGLGVSLEDLDKHPMPENNNGVYVFRIASTADSLMYCGEATLYMGKRTGRPSLSTYINNAIEYGNSRKPQLTHSGTAAGFDQIPLHQRALLFNEINASNPGIALNAYEYNFILGREADLIVLPTDSYGPVLVPMRLHALPNAPYGGFIDINVWQRQLISLNKAILGVYPPDSGRGFSPRTFITPAGVGYDESEIGVFAYMSGEDYLTIGAFLQLLALDHRIVLWSEGSVWDLNKKIYRSEGVVFIQPLVSSEFCGYLAVQVV